MTLHDGVPVPKVIDFGIAKATEGRLTDHTLFTAFEQFLGTPAYMSPEQAELSGLDIDTRSDIYSLGVLLYELLTGKTPFDAKELMQSGLDEMRRTIRETEPPKPSTRLTMELARGKTFGVPPAGGQGRSESVRDQMSDAPPAKAGTPYGGRRSPQETKQLINLLRGDLDWIVMKAIEKDRTRRYGGQRLALDVQRYLADEPVQARPPSNLYRFEKMVLAPQAGVRRRERGDGHLGHYQRLSAHENVACLGGLRPGGNLVYHNDAVSARRDRILPVTVVPLVSGGRHGGVSFLPEGDKVAGRRPRRGARLLTKS